MAALVCVWELCTRSSKSHPREWVVRSDPFYETTPIVVTLKSHQRQLVDGSYPFYLQIFSFLRRAARAALRGQLSVDRI